MVPSNSPIVISNEWEDYKGGQCVSVTDLDNSSKDPNPVRMLLLV